MKTGLVLGKFYPPHKGHIYLIERAKYNVDFLIVVVGSLTEQSIPVKVRANWLRELVPHNTQVVSIPDDNPPGVTDKDELYWTKWRENLLHHLPFKPNCLFASEDYGHKLAEIMGMTFLMIDKERSHFPISGTEIRKDPKKHWKFLPEQVQKYYANLLNH